ncbi:FAD binding domain-containing protein [Lutibaculum baratangense]|uniref:Xanthine dehydrogenase, FAD binding subunit n=1 Tax=Lutibaculum baratangense AMV1 TaxID=631454 RepID=V4R5F9_9HYPH|nr:FAD binding domain-containing protein [Lutibaculum baratangense]ESR27187.1 Xanthine dehydrogenase, FAD binding subunit [Lutibaculum baratangense AMV1]
MLSCDDYLKPKSLKEALQAVAQAPAGSRVIAGGTDTLPWAREGRAGDVHVPALIDVTKVAEFQGTRIENGRCRIGAAVPYQPFLDDVSLRAALPCMPYCAIWFADDQIREQATLAGNIVNASPVADGTPALLTLNAEVELARLEGDEVAFRRMKLAEFITGPGRTQLMPGELVAAIECETAEGYGGSFEKVGARRSLVISSVCVAGLVKTSEDGRSFADVRLAAGGVGPVAFRFDDIEDELVGAEISEAAVEKAADHAARRVASRSRVEYRREVIRGFVIRAVEDALARARPAIPHTPSLKEAIHA